MNVAVKKADAKPEPKTQEVRDLRTTLAWLKTQGDLIETDKEVDPDLQVTGLQKHVENQLARGLIAGTVPQGSTAAFRVDHDDLVLEAA